MSRARWIFIAAMFALVPCMSGCGKERAPSPMDQLVVGLEASPQSLDPRVPADAYSMRIIPLVFEGMFIIDRNSEPAPRLVESWEQPDELTFVFHLKRGRMFADGSELTARDVVHTFRSQGDQDLHSRRELVIERMESIEAVDDYTVRIKLKQPYAPFLGDLTLEVISEQADRDDRAGFSRKPFGSGPYMVESFEPGGEAVLIRNPHYAGPRPAIAKLRFRVIQDDVTRVMALERGEVQLLQNSVPPEDIPLLKNNPRLKLIMEPGSSSNYLGFNLQDPILKDLRVRRAIAHALNRDQLIDCFLQGSVTEAAGILGPSHWAYNDAVTTYGHDPEAARRLLDEAGYSDPDGDGPRPRFTLSYKTSQNKSRRWIAEAIANDLGEVGIEVEVRSYEFGTFFADIGAGAFQLYSLSWVGIVDPDIYYIAFHSSQFPPQGKNRNRYSNPQVDRLTEQGRNTLDRDRRRELYHEVQAILANDLPTLNLWYTNNLAAMDARLQGFEFQPGGDYRSLATASWQ